MRLDEVARIVGAEPPAGAGESDVADLAYDSRRTAAGSLFFCLRGTADDGHRHAPEAVARGAAALVCERSLGLGVPEVVVPDSRAAMNRLAAPFFGNPGRSLRIAGVTGTNGKTTTTYMLDSVFRAAGWRSGLIGTVEVRVAGESVPGARTTPESADLQRLLSGMLGAGVTACALEVTSIGLAQGRVEGTPFGVAVFTNLTRDHLDFHGDMDAYYAAKRALFAPGVARIGLANADDPQGRRLAAESEVEVVTYGQERGSDLRGEGVELSPRGARLRAVGLGMDLELAVPVPGAFNVSNALAAAGAARLLGVEPAAIAAGIAALPGIPGRFEPVDEGQEFALVVDYAHTPDSLENVLRAARPAAGGRVVAVFGCGGDRDRGKRPLMGEAAGRAADVVFLTSDNPRSEDPPAIIAEVERGLLAAPPPGGYRVVPDRREAIRAAVAEARPGDVVVVAGKGHETGQEVAGVILPFDDREVAAEALRDRIGSRRSR